MVVVVAVVSVIIGVVFSDGGGDCDGVCVWARYIFGIYIFDLQI